MLSGKIGYFRAAGFAPNSLGNLYLWLDAQDSSSYSATSGQVSSWTDKSGSGNTVSQSTANNRPTLFESSGNVQNSTASVINGKQSFFFDGTNDLLVSSQNITLPQWTAFAVVRPTAVSSTYGVVTADYVLGGIASTTATRGPQIMRVSSSQLQAIAFSSAGAVVTASVSSISNNTAVLLAARQGSTQLTAFKNGTAGTPQNATQNSSTVNQFAVGIASGTAQYWQGHIGEILIYNRSLTNSEMSSVNAYLQGRWGL